MFRRKSDNAAFKARSSERDVAADAARAKRVNDAIKAVLDEFESERSGLAKRHADALARAALTFGNETDEYTTRDAHDSAQQSALNSDIKYAERRLKELNAQIVNYRALKDAAERLGQPAS